MMGEDTPDDPASGVVKPIQRVSTMKIMDGLVKIQRPEIQAWYEPGTDLCYYEIALKAATETNTRLMTTQFSAEDKALLSKSLSPEVVVKYFETRQEDLVKIYQEREANPKLSKRIRDVGLGFIKLAQALDPIISIVVPSSPEYAIPYGCLKLAFKFIVDNATDRQDEIIGYLGKLSDILGNIAFENGMGSTGKMKKLMATIYVKVLDFLERVIEYTNLSGWGKMQKALQPKARKDYKFADRLTEVNELASELASHAERSRRAMDAEVSQLTILSAAAIERLYMFSRDSSSATSSSITLLERKIDELHESTRIWALSQASSSAYSLLDILLPDDQDLQDELDLWHGVAFKLSPGDYWERNGILEEFTRWGENMDVPFLAVGPYGTKDSWVTNFSLDLITLLRFQKQFLTFALCDRPDPISWSPTRLMKQLVGQLLEQNPMLMMQEPQIFNTRNFQKAKEMPQVWRIFKKIAARLDSLFVVIDRIDRCEGQDTMDISIGDDLLRMLTDLVTLHEGKIKVVITSAELPPQSLCEELGMHTVIIDTQSAQRKKIWESDDDKTGSTSGSGSERSRSLVDD